MGEAEPRRDLPPGASPISGLPPPVHTRWKKGQSGNPGGRPKGESLVALMRRVLEQDHHGRPIKEILAERLVKEALAGKHAFVKELLDRVEGPVNQQHQVQVKTDWRAAVAAMPEEDMIEPAVKHGMVDKLPVALRERAEKLLGGGDAPPS